MAVECRVFTHSVAGGSWLEDKPVKVDIGVRCVSLVLDGINFDVWLDFLCDGLSSLSCKGKVWRDLKKYLKSLAMNVERLRALSIALLQLSSWVQNVPATLAPRENSSSLSISGRRSAVPHMRFWILAKSLRSDLLQGKCSTRFRNKG